MPAAIPEQPSDEPDRSTPTGLRVHLPARAMPINTQGQRVSVAEYDRNDGFSPGSAVVVHLAGLDTAAAFKRTGAAALANVGRYAGKGQPIVIIDEQTARRQLIWSELDANAPSRADTDLLIHPGKNFAEGHTYVVALRGLRKADGKLIAPSAWFRRLRDGGPLPKGLRSQRARYERSFRALKRANIVRSNLYETWDFTVASTKSLTSRMLSIRNQAFAQLGDSNLADLKVQGRVAARRQKSDFLAPGGKVVDVRKGKPCHTDVYTP